VVNAPDAFNSKQKYTHFAVSLRSDGSLDFYCNFIWVSNFKGEEYLKKGETVKKRDEVVKIDIDFTRIYWETETGKSYVNSLSWQRLVGASTCKLKATKNNTQIDSCLDRRIASHFKLFAHILSF